MKKQTRSSGLLLHPTSLPGKFGIGELNQAAYSWIDFLAEAGQSVWQILPLCPTGYGNSPYQSLSVFAGNPLLIDIECLSEKGYISSEALSQAPNFSVSTVDYDSVIAWKTPLLLEAYPQFCQKASEKEKTAFELFYKTHDPYWLSDFAFYMALKQHFKSSDWNRWPLEIKTRHHEAMEELHHQLQAEIISHKFLQYLFFEQWTELRKYANNKGIRIFGDIPIYTTHDSVDVWANQQLFCLDEAGTPIAIAGVPPDYFSETGQLWGNPLYRWETMKNNGYRWWIDRIRHQLRYVDMIRIDHFRGFEAYWAVPFGEETAINGQWLKGPDKDFFESLTRELGELPIVAEDLGVITPEVEALRDRYGFPGMKILQFAFENNPASPFLPHNYPQNCVVYTGGHDNNTTHGWFSELDSKMLQHCIQYLGGTVKNISWDLIRLASASVAALSIFPVQDILDLGSESRMNTPGRAHGNWDWRLMPGQLQKSHATRLAEITEVYNRTGSH